MRFILSDENIGIYMNGSKTVAGKACRLDISDQDQIADVDTWRVVDRYLRCFLGRPGFRFLTSARSLGLIT